MNSFKVVLVAVIFILSVDTMYGQADTGVARNLSIGLGAKHYRLIDEAFSHERVEYHSTNFMLELAHQRLTDNYFFSAEMKMSSGNVSAPGQRPDARIIDVRIAAVYARNVFNYKAMKTSNQVYIGGQLSSSNYAIENVDEFDALTLTVYHTLNLFIFQKTTISARNQMEFSLSLPFVGFTKRESYEGGINQGLEEEYKASVLRLFFDHTKFSGVNPFTFPQLQIDFVHSIAPKTDFVLGYQFIYLKNTEIAPINLYSNAVVAKLRFNFNK